MDVVKEGGKQQKEEADNGEGLVMSGFVKKTGGDALYIFLVIISFGIVALVNRWTPTLYVSISHEPSSLSVADLVVVHRPWDPENPCDVCETERLPYLEDLGVVLGGESLVQNPGDLQRLRHEQLLTITYRHVRYAYQPPLDNFYPIQFDAEQNKMTYTEIHEKYAAGLTRDESLSKLDVFGANRIFVPLPSVMHLLLNEVLTPFYLFQMFSVVLWIIEAYRIYSYCIFLTSFISACWELVETRTNIMRLRDLAHSNEDTEIQVLEKRLDGYPVWRTCKITELTPGSIIQITDQMEVCCDMVLITGHCVVNESMLTGESIPIPKAPLPASESATIYNAEQDQAHTLFCGTKVVQIRPSSSSSSSSFDSGRVTACVIRTGYSTSKGELVRAMLFPKPHKFRFYQDSFKFIGVLCLIALVGFAYNVYLSLKFDDDFKELILDSLDVITVVVPPALPVAMSVGTSFALDRLRHQQVFCTSPPRINIAGKLNLLCFDKTGTLTESDLGVLGVVSVAPNPAAFELPLRPRVSDASTAMVQCLVSCHSLARIGEDLVGDPLEVKMFQATDWIFDDSHDPDPSKPQSVRGSDGKEYEILATVRPNENKPQTRVRSTSGKMWYSDQVGEEDPAFDNSINEKKYLLDPANPERMHLQGGVVPSEKSFDEPAYIPAVGTNVFILRRFGFSASLQRMSVIATLSEGAENLKGVADLQEDNFTLYCKGSPEMIASLCLPHTIPANFESVLLNYVQKGFRVLACARRSIPLLPPEELQRFPRIELERDLEFLGFLIMQNKLKDDTTGVIEQLVRARFRTVMITGDNPLTALAVGRECKIVPPKTPLYVSDIKKGADGEKVIVWRNAEEARAPEFTTEEFFHPIIQHYMDVADRVHAEYGNSTFLDESEGKEGLYKKKAYNIVGSAYGAVDHPSGGKRKSPLEISRPFALGITGPVFSLVIPEIAPEFTGDDELAELYLREADESQGISSSLLLHIFLSHGAIFARMKPEQKALLVEHMMGIGYSTAMVGDGANDCQSLKTAEVGLSLSEAEASIAASFTSKVDSIGSVVTLLREGRCALVTSFNCFKYMALYSIIQFTSVLVLFNVNAMLADLQYLYIDMFLILPFAFLMGKTGATEHLPAIRPTAALVSKRVLVSVFGQCAIQVSYQVMIFLVILNQGWYLPNIGRTDDINTLGQAITGVFLVSLSQYIGCCIAFSISKPFRKSIFSNRLFCLALLLLTSLSLYITLIPNIHVRNWMGIVELPFHFKLLILVFDISDVIVTFYYERSVVISFMHYLKERKARTRKRPPVKPHKWISQYSPTRKNLVEV